MEEKNKKRKLLREEEIRRRRTKQKKGRAKWPFLQKETNKRESLRGRNGGEFSKQYREALFFRRKTEEEFAERWRRWR